MFSFECAPCSNAWSTFLGYPVEGTVLKHDTSRILLHHLAIAEKVYRTLFTCNINCFRSVGAVCLYSEADDFAPRQTTVGT